MKKKIAFFINLIKYTFILLALVGTPLTASEIVVGYYPSWLSGTLPADQIDFKYLTHINHSFAWPDAQGNLILNDGLVYPQLNQSAHDHNVKISLALGGWGGSGGFAPMVADSLKRTKFINNLVTFLKNHQYDGIDLDWEFPGSSADRQNLTKFIQELRSTFDRENPDWLITMAVSIGDWNGRWFDYTKLIPYVDWFNAMCYDIHGNWSAHSGHNAPLYQPSGDNDGAVNVGMAYLHKTRSIPKTKLTVGMAFYGKEFNTSALYQAFTGTVTDYHFSKIIPKLNQGWDYHWDDVSKVPYLTNQNKTKLITFDDTLSIRLKCEWLKTQGYLGGMIWALGEDKTGYGQPLLKVVGEKLLDSTATTIFARNNLPSNFLVCRNYPNPFNPYTLIAFELGIQAKVEITVFNALGKKIDNLLNAQKKPGRYNVRFDGSGLPSGIYFYTVHGLTKNNKPLNISGKMLLLK